MIAQDHPDTGDHVERVDVTRASAWPKSDLHHTARAFSWAEIPGLEAQTAQQAGGTSVVASNECANAAARIRDVVNCTPVDVRRSPSGRRRMRPPPAFGFKPSQRPVAASACDAVAPARADDGAFPSRVDRRAVHRQAWTAKRRHAGVRFQGRDPTRAGSIIRRHAICPQPHTRQMLLITPACHHQAADRQGFDAKSLARSGSRPWPAPAAASSAAMWLRDCRQYWSKSPHRR